MNIPMLVSPYMRQEEVMSWLGVNSSPADFVKIVRKVIVFRQTRNFSYAS